MVEENTSASSMIFINGHADGSLVYVPGSQPLLKAKSQ